jgi:hypothetical protein
MSYRRSRARRLFEEQLDQALNELTPIHQFARKSGTGSAPRLLAAYYVFAFAQLEIYIKSVVEDSLNVVSTSVTSFDKWPDLMMAYRLHRGENLGTEYRKFNTSEDERALLEKVALAARRIAAWSKGEELPGAVGPAAFLEKKRYPSPKNLPQLFRRLGVQNIWAIVSAAGHMNSELVLTSLNDLRTNIAHEGRVPVGFGFNDFRSRLDQMKRFVAALDRGLSRHFCPDVISRAIWNDSMV